MNAGKGHLLGMSSRALASRYGPSPKPASSSKITGRNTTESVRTANWATKARPATRRAYIHPWLRSGPPSRAFPPPGMDNQRQSHKHQPTIQTDSEDGSKRWTRSVDQCPERLHRQRAVQGQLGHVQRAAVRNGAEDNVTGDEQYPHDKREEHRNAHRVRSGEQFFCQAPSGTAGFGGAQIRSPTASG